MTENSRYSLSFRSLSIWIMTAITSITLILAFSFSLYSQIQFYKQDMREQLEMLISITAVNIAGDVHAGNNLTAERRLRGLEAAPMITNTHIYSFNETGKQIYFTSYNKIGQTTVATNIGRIASLYEGKETEEIIELTYPIKHSGEKVGDVYMRASTAHLNYLVTEAIFYHGLVFVVMLIVAYALCAYLQRFFTLPLGRLTELLQTVTKSRDYSSRAQSSSINEIDQLAQALNVMLSRIQSSMFKQQEAEEQYKKLNTSLEQMVNQRTTALKEANQELIQTLEKLHQFQRQIVQNEKMASLGDMVAGVAHEVNTPIGLGVTASTMMLDRLASLKQQFESKSLKASNMARFIDEGEENLNIIYRNLNRAAELISSFKQVAVDQTSEMSRAVNIKQLVNEILLSLRPQLKKTKHHVVVNCDDHFDVETKAGPINQIIINLIVNSLIHAFKPDEEGTITLNIEMPSTGLIKFTYADNGMGIPESIRKRIFDPFVTTKRGQGGSGLGMHLVYNLVTQGLNGSISLTSEPGRGVEFSIQFPVKVASSKKMDYINIS